MTEIFDKDRMKVRTNVQQLNTIFVMGQELEGKVDDFMETTIDEQEFAEGLATKQDKLVSGTNIKTVFGKSILGSGDIPIDDSLSTSSTNPVENKAVTTRLNQKADKSELSTVATTGDYDDLSNKPDLSDFVTESELSTVAITGDYDDLTDKPTIYVNFISTIQPSVAQVGDLWFDNGNNDLYICTSITPNVQFTKMISGSGMIVNWSDVVNKPNFATVATTGDYDDLIDKPVIPSGDELVPDTTGATTGDVLAVGSSGTEWVTPITPVQSNWNEADTTSLAYIQNKPTIPAAQVQSDWSESDTTDPSYIQNKPTIPSGNELVPNIIGNANKILRVNSGGTATEWVSNYNITISSSSPSGGNNGDIWLKYEV